MTFIFWLFDGKIQCIALTFFGQFATSRGRRESLDVLVLSLEVERESAQIGRVHTCSCIPQLRIVELRTLEAKGEFVEIHYSYTCNEASFIRDSSRGSNLFAPLCGTFWMLLLDQTQVIS